MRINWYPVMGLLFMILFWVFLATMGWFVWKTVIQPKVEKTVKVIEVNFSQCEIL
jgi:p-aminobenzoyl-glutamate transporter AbgT